MCAAGVQVARQLDNHQTVMLFAYLGLQIGAVAAVGGTQEMLAVGVERWCHFFVRGADGHSQQAAFNQRVELGRVGEVQCVDIHQWAVLAAAAGFDLLRGIIGKPQRFLYRRLKHALASAQGQGDASHGSKL